MKKIIIIIIILTITFTKTNNKQINYVSPMYVYDTTKQEIAVGASSYVFVGKINKKIKTEYVDNNPYTVYSVHNLLNIKGSLKENLTLRQYGGLNKDKKSYTFIENSGYLKENSLYILLVGTNEKDQLEVADPNRIIKLPTKSINSKENLKIIKEYETAYENEEIPTSQNGIKLNT